MTLKGHGKYGRKLNLALQISSPTPPPPPHPHPRKKKFDQFLSSRRKVPRFQILFLDFVWKENCLNQKTFTGVLFCDTEEPCKLWDKTECCFPNKPSKNWSISFQRAKRVQISYSTAFFCQKHKLLERKDLHRKCIW